MIALLGSILASSLLGSPHCAAMCGGFACFYAGTPGTGTHRLATIAYHGGRLISYLLLGASAGAIGAGVDAAGRLAGATRTAAVLAGLLMASWGAVTILRTLGLRLPGVTATGRLRGLLHGAMRHIQQRPPVTRAAVLGLVTTLLPCGWLYVFVATAGGTGTPWEGALVMAVFWLGTVPMLAGLGVAVQRLSGPMRRRLPVMTAAAMVVIGLLTAAGRLGGGLGAASPNPQIHDHR